jgi:hypothetical protein
MVKIDNKVVVRFRDGRMVKGDTHDFNLTREIFHVTETQEGGKVLEVTTSPLKAIFFVFPADKESNNERIFVIRKSTDAVETWR